VRRGTNHRLDLASSILIKNNHISLGGGLPAVLTPRFGKAQKGQRVQVEVRNAKELEEALEYGAEAILLDNMTPEEVKRSVERIRRVPRGKSRRWISHRSSGGICSKTSAPTLRRRGLYQRGRADSPARPPDISMRIHAETA